MHKIYRVNGTSDVISASLIVKHSGDYNSSVALIHNKPMNFFTVEVLTNQDYGDYQEGRKIETMMEYYQIYANGIVLGCFPPNTFFKSGTGAGELMAFYAHALSTMSTEYQNDYWNLQKTLSNKRIWTDITGSSNLKFEECKESFELLRNSQGTKELEPGMTLGDLPTNFKSFVKTKLEIN